MAICGCGKLPSIGDFNFFNYREERFQLRKDILARSIFIAVFITLLGVSLCLGDGRADAKEIVWANADQLRDDPVQGDLKAFFPDDSLSGNKVTVNGGTPLEGGVYGGVSAGNGSIANNEVSIGAGSVIDDGVAGGAGVGPVSNNRVRVSGGSMAEIAGGLSMRSDSTGNSVEVAGGSIAGGDGVAAGVAFNGNAADNSVVFSGAAVDAGVAGGYVGTGGNATGNNVKINGGTINFGILGGFVMGGSGNAHNNSVTIDAGTINADLGVYGGLLMPETEGGAATNNSLTVNGGTIVGIVAGGVSEWGSVSGNTVTIAGGDLSTLDNDGDSENDISGGLSENSDSKNNRVTISGGYVHNYDDIFGGVAEDGEASENELIISGGKVAINGSILGGSVFNGSALTNKILISGGNVSHEGPGSGTNIVGGEAYGEKIAGAVGNEVVIKDGTITVSNIVGGFVGGNSKSQGVRNNSVSISGGTVNANVYGGFDQSDGNAVDNTVTLSGAPKFEAERLIRGGRVINGSDSFSGNTLNIVEYTGSGVGDILGFQYFNFTLPENLSKGETILKANGTVYLNDKVNNDAGAGKGSQIKEINLGKNANIAIGDTIVLIDAEVLDTASFAQDGETVSGTDGKGGRVAWTITVDTASTPNKLEATLNENSKNSSSSGCSAAGSSWLAGLVALGFAAARFEKNRK
jgi:hypothetical protein